MIEQALISKQEGIFTKLIGDGGFNLKVSKHQQCQIHRLKEDNLQKSYFLNTYALHLLLRASRLEKIKFASREEIFVKINKRAGFNKGEQAGKISNFSLASMLTY